MKRSKTKPDSLGERDDSEHDYLATAAGIEVYIVQTAMDTVAQQATDPDIVRELAQSMEDYIRALGYRTR